MTDMWAAADAAQNGGTGQQGAEQGGGNLAGGFAPQGGSQLFNTPQGAGPGILNKTHPVGTKRKGRIVRVFDRQSTNMAGKPKFWQDIPKMDKPVLEPISPTGERNRPVMDTVLVLDTDYVMDAAEAKELGRETPFDGGRRSYTLAGRELKSFQEAMLDFNSRHRDSPIGSEADLEGLNFEVHRYAERPNPNGGHTIKDHTFRLDRA